MPIIINKRVAETPLQAIEDFKKKNPKHKNSKIGYAGRLDPMAEGALLLLVNEENKQFKKYANLDKEYQAKILLGVKTDSYDLLGIPNFSKIPENAEDLLKKIKSQKTQILPPFSSYRIKGKPLFYYAKKNLLPKILPKTKIKIKDIKIIKKSKISAKRLLSIVEKRVKKLKGNFRQKKIINSWKKLIKKLKSEKKEKKHFPVLEVKIKCSSGTYIRSIANNADGTLIHLKREKIGKYKVKK